MGDWISCRRNGVIVFGGNLPEGHLPICPNTPELRRKVKTRARLSYDGNEYLVPGIPEADTDDEARRALEAFCAWMINDKPSMLRPDDREALSAAFEGSAA